MSARVFALVFPLLALCIASGSARADDSATGKIFEPKLSPNIPLFLYEQSRSPIPGGTKALTRYVDPSGKPVVEEETVLENGKLKSYRYLQHQTDESGDIQVKDGKVFFTFTAQGKTETDDEDFEGDMIVADMVQDRIRSSWKQLMDGDSVPVRFLLLERLESIGFKLFRDEERNYNGKAAVDIIMKPSSFIIAAIAPSIRITVEKAPPHRLLETFGRLPVRVPKVTPPQKRDDWRAIDARLVLEYSAPADSAATPAESAPSAQQAPAQPKK